MTNIKNNIIIINLVLILALLLPACHNKWELSNSKFTGDSPFFGWPSPNNVPIEILNKEPAKLPAFDLNAVTVQKEKDLKSVLNLDQQWAIKQYTRTAYTAIKECAFYDYNPNYAVCQNRFSGTSVEKYAQNLKSGISKIPPSEGPVYRGIQANKKYLDFLVLKLQRGETIGLGPLGTKNWASTSRGLHTAKKSAGCEPFMGFYRIFYVIEQKCGRSIESLSLHPMEKEILIPPTSQFRIEDLRIIDDSLFTKGIMVKLREVLPIDDAGKYFCPQI